MLVNINKGSSATAYTNVVAIVASNSGTPSIQIIHKTTDTIHCDNIQSADITSVGITMTDPQT